MKEWYVSAPVPWRGFRKPVPGALFWLICSAAVCACSPPQDPNAIDRETYIETYVQILRAAAAAPDSSAATDSALSILARRQLTEDRLTAFAIRHANDPSYLADAWGEIERRLREPPAPSAPPDSG